MRCGRYLALNQMEMGNMGMDSGDMPMMAAGGTGTESGGTGIWILPMQLDPTPRRFVTSKPVQGSGRFSPDGKLSQSRRSYECAIFLSSTSAMLLMVLTSLMSLSST